MNENKNTTLELLQVPDITPVLNNLSSSEFLEVQNSLEDKNTIKKLLRLSATSAWSKASAILASLKKEQGQRNLAEIFVETSNLLARQICTANNWLPGKAEYRAIFYLLTDHWETYLKFDPDNSLLTKGFISVSLGTQRRILEKLREKGYAHIATGLVGRVSVTNTQRQQLITKVQIGGLIKQKKFAELWRLLQKTSPYVGRIILEELVNNGWQPDTKDETAIFERLFTLSKSCLSSNFCSKYPVSIELEQIDELQVFFKAVRINATKNLIAVPHIEFIWENTPFSVEVVANSYDLEEYHLPSNYKIAFWNLSGKRQTELELTMPAEWFQNFIIDRKNRMEFVSSLWDKDLLAFSIRIKGVINIGGMLQYVNDGEECCGIWVIKELEAGGYEQHFLETLRPANTLSYAPSNNLLLATVSDEYTFNPIEELLIFSTESFKLIEAKKFVPEHVIKGFCLSPDGKSIAVIANEGMIKLYDLPSFKLTKEILTWQPNISSLRFSSDGKILATLPQFRLWNIEEGGVIKDFNDTIGNGEKVIFNQDNSLFAVEYPSKMLKLWSDTGEYLDSVEFVDTPQTISFCNNFRNVIAFTSFGKSLLNWRISAAHYAFLWAEKSTYADAIELQQILLEKNLAPHEKAWLEYSYAYHGMKWRFDIELDPTIDVTLDNYDIEIEI